ncbi:MAG: hypothetical protein IPP42_01045 [Saprospiraceae bacterium]|nr:hypothetical protein [Saprospiraceae bacterium]
MFAGLIQYLMVSLISTFTDNHRDPGTFFQHSRAASQAELPAPMMARSRLGRKYGWGSSWQCLIL